MLGLYSHQFRDKVFTDRYEGKRLASMTDAQLAHLVTTKLDEIEAAQFGKYGQYLRLLQVVERRAWAVVNGVRKEQFNRSLERGFNKMGVG